MHTVLYPTAKAILPRLTTCVFPKGENLGRFFNDPPGICSKDIKDNKDATQVVIKWKFVSAVFEK